MKRAAVIDIGTNSVKLTVADLSDTITIVKEDSKITRLGRNVDRDGRLHDEAIELTLAAIQTFADVARQSGATTILAAGTSALRDAANGDELLSAVKSSTGLEIEIIAGLREASLAFRAVSGDQFVAGDHPEDLLVFDIGGGSTELIWGGGDGTMEDHVSLNIGALRLTERHFHTDPPTDSEFSAASLDGAEAVNSFISGKGSVSAVCGVGGTATTLASVIKQTKDVHGQKIAFTDLEKCANRLRSVDLQTRRLIPFLEPERADIIIAGAAILLGILEAARADSFTVSVRGMRFGLLLELKTGD